MEKGAGEEGGGGGDTKKTPAAATFETVFNCGGAQLYRDAKHLFSIRDVVPVNQHVDIRRGEEPRASCTRGDKFWLQKRKRSN